MNKTVFKQTILLAIFLSLSGCNMLKQQGQSVSDSNVADTLVEVDAIQSPTNKGIPLETTQLVVPEGWAEYTEPAYGYTISYPSNFEVTPAPTQGHGGLTRYRGENSGEDVWIEVGVHQGIYKKDDESLREVELSRSPETEFEYERLFEVNGLAVYQQLVGLRSGYGPDPKTHGIYNIFELNGEIYFLELYTSQPFDQFELVSQMLGSIKVAE